MPKEKECVEELINAIRIRPVIYNKMHKDHKDQMKLTMAWQEVFDTLVGTFNQEELIRAKISTVREIKDKWHSLR